MENIKVKKSSVIFSSHKDLAVEKHLLGMDDKFTDFPNKIRLQIQDGISTSYMSFFLKTKDNYNAIYKSNSPQEESLLIMPVLPMRKS